MIALPRCRNSSPSSPPSLHTSLFFQHYNSRLALPFRPWNSHSSQLLHCITTESRQSDAPLSLDDSRPFTPAALTFTAKTDKAHLHTQAVSVPVTLTVSSVPRKIPHPTIQPRHLIGPIVTFPFHEQDCKTVRTTLKQNLLQASSPRDVYRVLASAKTTRTGLSTMIGMSGPFMAVAYRMRANFPDRKVLSYLRTVWKTLSKANSLSFRQGNQPRGLTQSLPTDLLAQTALFAARIRDIHEMRQSLALFSPTNSQFQEAGSRKTEYDGTYHMTPSLFYRIAAKVGIGRYDGQRLRNGTWREDDLRDIVLGESRHWSKTKPMESSAATTGEGIYLGSFVDRTNWTSVQAWVSLLRRCGEVDRMWDEYILWYNRLRVPPSSPLHCHLPRSLRFFSTQFIESQRPDLVWAAIAHANGLLSFLRTHHLAVLMSEGNLLPGLKKGLQTSKSMQGDLSRTVPDWAQEVSGLVRKQYAQLGDTDTGDRLSWAVEETIKLWIERCPKKYKLKDYEPLETMPNL